MQLKGLVRFFTVLLIIYSLYQLSFTWFVKNHEKKMEAKAKSYVKTNFQPATQKYPNNKDSQEIYQEVVDKAYRTRLTRLFDSTKDVTVTYGINGPVSFQKAKEEELNLGLDLQGGMNVTLEVEMTGLLKSLSNNSKDPNFLAAIVNADNRKANSDANFITLFIEEYRKLEKTRPLASLFAGASNSKIDINSSDNKTESYLREEAKSAFGLTFDRLVSRIDQFGVAQPNINSNPDKATITVELPGIQDKERVRKNLQSSANLQFWELYNLSDIGAGIGGADAAFFAMMGGKAKDTTKKLPVDSAQQVNQKEDTTSLSKIGRAHV